MSTEFPYQEARSLLLEYIQQNPRGQYAAAVRGVIDLAKRRGLYGGAKSAVRRIGGSNYDLGGADADRVPERVRQLLWELLVHGILVFGKDDLNPNWPWYRLTEYGEKALAEQQAQPYDPDGFLDDFAAVNPSADETVTSYLSEAVHTFNSGCYKASAVMLGCASEQLVLLLHEALGNSIKQQAKRDAFRKSSNWTIHSKFSSVRDGLEDMIAARKLPKELHEVVRSDLVSGFELIRRCRNSAGHPGLSEEMRRETIFMNLTVFREYARQVLRLIAHFRGQP